MRCLLATIWSEGFKSEHLWPIYNGQAKTIMFRVWIWTCDVVLCWSSRYSFNLIGKYLDIRYQINRIAKRMARKHQSRTHKFESITHWRFQWCGVLNFAGHRFLSLSSFEWTILSFYWLEFQKPIPKSCIVHLNICFNPNKIVIEELKQTSECWLAAQI